jgi:uncharacterized protein (DUF1015 family)
MAEIRAFRAYRYDLGRVGALSDVVAPPDDEIDPALQQALYDRSPYNVVRLILNKESPADSEADNRYTRAAGVLRDWLRDDVLLQDSARSLYVCHQEFEVEGRPCTRKGFLARVRLEPFGPGHVDPHEETLAGPRADRLRLFHATHMNLSPVFGLYPDPRGEVDAVLDRAVGRSLPLEAVDPQGAVSRLWPVSDQHAVSAVAGLLGPRPVFLADGRHCYEAGLRYLEERRAAGEVRDAEAPANFILMMLVSLSDPGLVVLPTHRLVSGLGELRAGRLAELLAPCFEVEKVGEGPAGARAAWELVEADGGQELLGFGTTADGVWQTARLTAPAEVARLAPSHSPAWRNLAAAVLHVLVLDRLLGPALGARPACRYVHRLREVQEAAASRQCQLAALVPPATVRHVEEVAGNGETMPTKSTCFYPKLLSGLVFNPLRTS